jgi:hypothetical protein
MTEGLGHNNRREPIRSKIRSLLVVLSEGSSNYDHIAPNIEYWIESVLREGFALVDELVEGVSAVAWGGAGVICECWTVPQGVLRCASPL